MTVVAEIAELIARRRGGPVPPLSEGTDLETDLRMNSAEVVDLLAEVEDHFGCTVADGDLDDLHRVGDLVAIVARSR